MQKTSFKPDRLLYKRRDAFLEGGKMALESSSKSSKAEVLEV